MTPPEGVHGSSCKEADGEGFVSQDEVSSVSVEGQGGEGVHVTEEGAEPSFAEGPVHLAVSECNGGSFLPDALHAGGEPRGHGSGWAVGANDPEG